MRDFPKTFTKNQRNHREKMKKTNKLFGEQKKQKKRLTNFTILNYSIPFKYFMYLYGFSA